MFTFFKHVKYFCLLKLQLHCSFKLMLQFLSPFVLLFMRTNDQLNKRQLWLSLIRLLIWTSALLQVYMDRVETNY